ncbi:unnamed protein product [Fraxinus pennsylvanica]|uniref:Uncharacterized protein n=1 Tax=Fraxinus pennsylvanica TaxID=56036 RepID=A0AAD2DU91_9LAMI|nr:unnamed protein product [Fraxinus pennsylvanica]
MSTKLSLFGTTPFSFHTELPSTSSKIPVISHSPLILPSNHSHTLRPKKSTGVLASCVTAAKAEVEVEVAEGYTVTQFCDKIIDVFLNEKPKSRDWKRFLVLREEWKKYSESFYSRCKNRANADNDSGMKQKLIELSRKVKKIDDGWGWGWGGDGDGDGCNFHFKLHPA